MNETFEDYCNRKGWSGYTEPLREIWNDWQRDRECLIANMEHAEQQRDELLDAAKITLRENLDLADGDCCTLYDLRTSVESVAPEWDMYGDCEAIAKAGGEA